MRVEFPEFLPDLPALDNPGTTIAQNVIPSGKSYKPVYSLNPYSTALTARSRGFITARESQFGTSNNFTGDATKLYRLGSTTLGTWDDVSKAGGYTLASDDQWSFAQFGERIVAVNLSTVPQSFHMVSSSLFADLAGSPPQAKYVATVKDFLFLANTYDAVDGFVPTRVRWCGIGDATSWTVSATTMADYQDLDSKYGWINAIVGGEYLVVFQERAITRFDFIGSPAVWQVTVVEINQGTQISKSVIPFGNQIYYIGIDGFYVFNGTSSTPIGSNKIDNFFFDDFNTSLPDLVYGGVDYINQVLMWSYPGAGSLEGMSNKVLFYNYTANARNKWAYAFMNTEALFVSMTEGYTLDGIDAYQTGIGQTPSIDATNPTLPSFDSAFWRGNDFVISAFDSNHKLAYFSGTPLTAIIETSEVQLNEGWKSDLFSVRPLIEGAATLTAQVGTRDLQTDAVVYGSLTPMTADGAFDFRAGARYHRLRLIMTSGSAALTFDHALGFDIVSAQKSGRR